MSMNITIKSKKKIKISFNNNNNNYYYYRISSRKFDLELPYRILSLVCILAQWFCILKY